MEILQISEGKISLKGDFNLSVDSQEFNADLNDLYELIVKNVNFNKQHGVLEGFAESSNGDILTKELKKAGILYKYRSGDLLIFVNNTGDLKMALRAWAEEAGAAGLFFLIVSPIGYDIEELAQQYASSRQRPLQASLILEDLSDGDRNLFSIESIAPLSLER